MFYISAYFEANRDEYYDRLLAVSRDNDWSGWCAFFLKAVQQQAEQNLERANAVLALYGKMKTQIAEVSHSQFSIHALDWIFETPIFNSSGFTRTSGIPKATATRILRVLKEENVLEVWSEGRGSKPAVYAYVDLLNMAEGYQAF